MLRSALRNLSAGLLVKSVGSRDASAHLGSTEALDSDLDRLANIGVSGKTPGRVYRDRGEPSVSYLNKKGDLTREISLGDA